LSAAFTFFVYGHVGDPIKFHGFRQIFGNELHKDATLPVLDDNRFNMIAHCAFKRTPIVVWLIWINAA
jgi:hypothetical protein